MLTTKVKVNYEFDLLQIFQRIHKASPNFFWNEAQLISVEREREREREREINTTMMVQIIGNHMQNTPWILWGT